MNERGNSFSELFQRAFPFSTYSGHPTQISLGSAENKNYFLRELTISNDLLTVTEFIKDDLFWEGQYKAVYGPRFQRTPQGKWLQVFMEKHLQEWLEKLKPCDYEGEQVLERLELYALFVEQLTMHNFQTTKQEIHHIPLGVFFQNLTQLKRIDLSVNIKDAGVEFSDGCSNLSDKDINTLAAGLELCDILEFKLEGTKLSPAMAKRLGSSLEKCRNLKLLHLPSCNLADHGVISFLMGLLPDALLDIEDLNLSNNFICKLCLLLISHRHLISNLHYSSFNWGFSVGHCPFQAIPEALEFEIKSHQIGRSVFALRKVV